MWRKERCAESSLSLKTNLVVSAWPTGLPAADICNAASCKSLHACWWSAQVLTEGQESRYLHGIYIRAGFLPILIKHGKDFLCCGGFVVVFFFFSPPAPLSSHHFLLLEAALLLQTKFFLRPCLLCLEML